ncbi:hypothetical protein N7462_007133 [Penicillium macrosclerotiorum]|uniref:uncharacterized protein n=1 Tax=Penicillium macrosclerotiorum TaxID=303699 RepID=UPI0025499930|nr:uncharacterized protein N7462_007133 [Penicillium macrosclerotiorum]KAJ5678889.1 hypothetical protein N7462_007133 [Penicillium macrosclerotiorum]
MEPPSKKMKTLLDDDSSSDSGDDAGGVSLGNTADLGFKINEDYARRFEHNKKREEYGKTTSLGKRRADEPSDDESSSDEEEDDEGELATEALDAEIMATLKAIRTKDPRVYDKDVTFYSKFDEDEANAAPKEKGEKSMTLRDYHRENLLSGVNPADEEDTPRTFAQEQADLKSAIVKEMHAAGSDDEEMEDADNFLVRKSGPEELPPAISKADLDIENADKNPETFLSNFMASRAWIPEENKRELHPFDSDDDEEFNRADAFEEAYNFRFEDPSKLNEKLVTHARDTTNSLSVRREDKSARKKLRDAERERKEQEKKQRETEKNRLRKLKTEELQRKVNEIKEVAGLRASEFTDDDWARFLDESWDDKEWEKEMEKRFGEDYYEQGGVSGKNHPKKPTWDDDIDIKDLIPDYEDEETAKPSVESDEDMEEEEEAASGSQKKSKAELKREQKREARKDRLRIEEAVDRNLDLDITLLPGATKKNATRFRYRETSPQSFGLTARDILMADDTQLNQFAGLKKLASFRDAEKKAKDERKLGKKPDTFGSEEGPAFTFGQGDVAENNAEQDDGDGETKVDIREGDGRRKKRKRSKKN